MREVKTLNFFIHCIYRCSEAGYYISAIKKFGCYKIGLNKSNINMENSNLISLTKNQLKETEGGWIYLMPPAGFAPMVFQILSIKSAVEGYKDATKT